MEIHHFIEHNCRTRPMLAKTDKELRTSDKLADLYPAISCFFLVGQSTKQCHDGSELIRFPNFKWVGEPD